MEVPNEVQLFLHCLKCAEELPEGQSPMEYARTQAGWTDRGLQIWCNRHNMNVMHLDFKATYKAIEEIFDIEIPYNGIMLAELDDTDITSEMN